MRPIRKVNSKKVEKEEAKSKKVDADTQVEVGDKEKAGTTIKRRRGPVKKGLKMKENLSTSKMKSVRKRRSRVKIKENSKSSKCQAFFCDKCDKVYDQYSELVYHERRHTGEKPYVCFWPDCKKAFAASNARIRHLRTHTGERPYSCAVENCGRTFTYWKDLKLHKLRHKGEKPHKCEWEGCTARFFRKDDLKHHIYTHTGEKPYKCTWPGCNACFTQKSPLNLHIRKIHKNEPTKKQAAIQNNTNPSIQNLNSNPPLVILPSYVSHCENVPISYASQENSGTIIHHPQMQFNHSQVIGIPSCNQETGPLMLTCPVSPNPVPFTNWSMGEGSYTITENNMMNNVGEPVTVINNYQQIVNDNFEIHASANQIPAEKSHQSFNLQTGIQPAELSSSPQNAPLSGVNNISNITISSENGISENASCGTVKIHSNENMTKYTNHFTNSIITVTSVPDSDPLNNTNRSKIVQAIILPKSMRKKRKNYRMKDQQKGDGGKKGKKLEYEVVELKKTRKGKVSGRKERAGKKRTIAIQTAKRNVKTNDGMFQCDYCSREFKAKHDRDCHRMTHTGEKPRICDWPGCDYRCITKSKLLRHKRKHTGERNYPCDWEGCQKRFATSRHLREHKRSHTGEKPFKCDWPGCDKYFSRKDHIKNHKFIHTGEKPRKCTFPGCDSAFIQLTPLKKHMELHKRDGGLLSGRKRRKPMNPVPPSGSGSSSAAVAPAHPQHHGHPHPIKMSAGNARGGVEVVHAEHFIPVGHYNVVNVGEHLGPMNHNNIQFDYDMMLRQELIH